MGGNRKHGFASGNKAGRNGVGTQKGFYCDACEKTHSASVERTGVKLLLGVKEDVFVCDRKYFQFKDSLFNSKSEVKVSGAITKLKRLKPKTGQLGVKSLKARVDFVATVFIFDLYHPLIRYELFDKHNIGERDYDTCFEMYDSSSVIHGIINLAHKNYWLKCKLKEHIGFDNYKQWQQTFTCVENAVDFKAPSDNQLEFIM